MGEGVSLTPLSFIKITLDYMSAIVIKTKTKLRILIMKLYSLRLDYKVLIILFII